jgi:hypothetical protein
MSCQQNIVRLQKLSIDLGWFNYFCKLFCKLTYLLKKVSFCLFISVVNVYRKLLFLGPERVESVESVEQVSTCSSVRSICHILLVRLLPFLLSNRKFQGFKI